LADPARTAALEVLRAVRAADAYTNLALPAALKKHGLSGRDAAFATELTSGTVRRQGLYDAVLAACVDRPLAKVQARVLDALRLGAHQLLAMRVPAHAAISTTVALVRSDVGPGAAGFANAVLRRVSEHDEKAWVARVAPARADDPVGYLSVAHAHPRWVVEALAEAVGEAEIEALLVADNEAPGVTLVARPGRSTREELPGEPTRWSPYGAHLASGDPGAVAAVADGRAGVQDEGSQLVALALASAPLDGPDVRWLDLCAGPGGKAALLAALAAGQGAGLVANERLPHRADLVRRTLRGADGVLGVVTGDGTRPPWPAGSFDRVLVDAPCTGLGALRRRPEARWRRQPTDLDALVPLQQALLSAALDSVRPGGVVLYATCSPVLAETSQVVSAVLGSRSDAELEDAAALLPDVPDCAGPLPGTFQLWPHRHGTDAMFGALLRRVLG
jgi:16S rRNA (cytosine967-C5)-methyltransferase